MARRVIPDPLRRRHVVESALDAGRSLAIAEAYLEEGRRLEAVDFLRKAEARERLAALRDEAVEEGNVFLLRATTDALGEPPDAGQWERAAARAAATGRALDAAEAERQAARLRS
jgi:hypothetical protein